ncbi:hypothetical protein THAOC_33297, partial [Thalassiosira oceanica]
EHGQVHRRRRRSVTVGAIPGRHAHEAERRGRPPSGPADEVQGRTGRVNFAKASCTLDASVKIYSYRVDDVHLSSYRVLANLNRSDTNKGRAGGDHEDGGAEDGEEAGGGRKSMRRQRRAGPTETIESNLANINMSKLDSAYDIDPLFHKMSKSFDEGGAKGLLLGNLGVSTSGCHVVFDSKEATADTRGAAAGKPELEKIEEGAEENEAEDGCTAEDNMADAGPAWKESQIDITNLSAKLEQMLASYGHETSATVPFVPQLESLRQDYARLEEEGYGVDEYSSMAVGRKRLKLYDADEEDEREAEKSIHEMSMARSTGSLLGMTFDTNFRLSMDPTEAGPGGDIVGGDDFVGEGEFAPDFGGGDDVSFGGGDGEFAPDLGGGDDGGFSADGGGTDFGSGSSRHDSARVLLDALCSGDAFYEGGAESDYAFFDLKKLEKATDGNLWAGSQHWKKRPNAAKSAKKGDGGKKKVAFDNDDAGGDEKKKRKTKAKARVIIDFSEPPDVNAIFEKKKKKPARKTKKAPKDPYQMSRTEKDYLLPPDAGVDISQLTRLFSRPNAVVRRTVPDSKGDGPVGKTVGFVDVEENPLGFDVNDGDDADFGGGDDGGFTFGYDDEDPAAGPAQEDDNADYNLDDFDEVRKVEKIEVNYATVAKKVDVRRLKRDLWAELEEKTAWVVPEKLEDPIEDNAEDDIFDEEDKNKMEGEPQYVSFKNTVEKLDSAQSQSDVTVSFYFICCLHLANEKGLKLESTGLDDFTVSLDDGSAPTFGDFGDFSQTANKLRGKREAVKNVVNYVEDSEGE